MTGKALRKAGKHVGKRSNTAERRAFAAPALSERLATVGFLIMSLFSSYVKLGVSRLFIVVHYANQQSPYFLYFWTAARPIQPGDRRTRILSIT